MLKIDNISVSYGKSKVVTNVSFELNSSDRLVILGRNGVGKTTLLKGIVGVLPTNSGNIILNGKDITKKKAFEKNRSGIAYVPQGREIIPKLTVKENLEIGAIAHGINYATKSEEVFEYFPILRQHLKRKGGVLSGGQQQQLAIARALMSEPKILIFDEPTEGIQPNIVSEIASILLKYHEKNNVPIIMVEQNLKFARKLGNKFVIIQKGMIVANGDMCDLSDEMCTKYLSV